MLTLHWIYSWNVDRKFDMMRFEWLLPNSSIVESQPLQQQQVDSVLFTLPVPYPSICLPPNSHSSAWNYLELWHPFEPGGWQKLCRSLSWSSGHTNRYIVAQWRRDSTTPVIGEWRKELEGGGRGDSISGMQCIQPWIESPCWQRECEHLEDPVSGNIMSCKTLENSGDKKTTQQSTPLAALHRIHVYIRA